MMEGNMHYRERRSKVDAVPVIKLLELLFDPHLSKATTHQNMSTLNDQSVF